MAIVVLEDGFESLAKWTIANTSVLRHRTGRTGMGMSADSSAGTAVFTIPAASESDTITIGFAWRIETLNGTRPMLTLRSDANVTTHLTVDSNATGSLEVRRGTTTGTVLASSAAGFVAGTWYYVELQAKLHDTTGFVTLRVNGVQVASATNVDTKNAGTKTTFDTIFMTTGSTVVQVWDDLYAITGSDGAFRGDRTYEGTGPFDVSHEGFQSGLGAWTSVGLGGPPAIGTGRNGNGLQLVNSGQEIALAVPAGKQSPFFIVGFALRVEAVPVSATDFLKFRNGGTVIVSLRMEANGALSLAGTWGITPAGAIPVASGAWVYVEVSVLINVASLGTGAEVEIHVNETQRSYQRDFNLSFQGPVIDNIRFSGMASALTFVDDMYVLSGTLANFEGDKGGLGGVPTRYWNGTAWVDGPAKVWDGAAWMSPVAIKTWNGSAWV